MNSLKCLAVLSIIILYTTLSYAQNAFFMCVLGSTNPITTIVESSHDSIIQRHINSIDAVSHDSRNNENSLPDAIELESSDEGDRFVGRWRGDLPVWLCNLFATVLPFYSCAGDIWFYSDGTASADDMTITDIEGGRKVAEPYIHNLTWEVEESYNSDPIELFFRWNYQGVPVVEHYVVTFRRRGKTDLMMIYDLKGNLVGDLHKVSR
jgi:hypothetical protein